MKKIIFVLTLCYSFIANSQNQTKNYYFDLGEEFLSKTDYVNALNNFDLAIKSKSFSKENQNLNYPLTNSKLYYFKGFTLFKTNRYTEALVYYNLSISSMNTKEYYWNQALQERALLKCQLNHFDSAIEDLNVIINSYNDSKANYGLQIFLKLNKPAEISRAYCLRAFAKIKINQFEAAYEDVDLALSYNHENSEAYLYGGLCMLNTGEKDKGCLKLIIAESLGNQEVKPIFEKYCTN